MEEHEIELEVTRLMQELQKVSIDIENVIEPYANIIDITAKAMDEASEPYSKKSVELQDKIKQLILLRAKSLKTGSGNITYKKGGVRRKWDLDALDEVCKANDVIREKIWAFRTEDEFPPQVLIKVETKGTSIAEL